MIIDILILIVIAISVVIAFFRGFIREVLTIFGVGGGLLAAYFFGPVLSPQMRSWLGVDEADPEKLFGVLPFTTLADILSYLGIFILVVILLSIISHLLSEAAKSVGLGAIDRTLGIFFGFVRAVLIVSLLYLPFQSGLNDETKEKFFEGSQTYIYLEMSTSYIAGFMPGSDADDSENRAEKTFEGVTQGAREKLQEMQVLNEDGDGLGQIGDDIGGKLKEAVGYDENFRDQMDQLVEDIDIQPAESNLND